ncbi:MAG: hypothetical protein ACOX6T_14075 [Myxococcales bacterium]
MRTSLAALLTLLLPACSLTPQTTAPTNTSSETPAAQTEQRAAGANGIQTSKPAACETTSDCPERTVCQGGEGCEAVWTCEDAARCTRDLVPFCGCDGKTFHASSTCPARKFSRRGPCGLDERVAPQPVPCTSSSDCAEGEFCQGPEGCSVQWTCQPERPCTRDRRAFCGCDGTTFSASSTCPTRPYAHRGKCE